MKEFILSYRKTIITHSIAFILGFTIAYFVFTSVDDAKTQNKVLELENVKGQIESKESDLVPVVDLEDALKSKDAEIQDLNSKYKQSLIEIKKLKDEKISNVTNLSDADLERFITEWAKANGRLPQ
jgi:GH25 family lysozyme M1 (1,4-beta-N-acetylmuramidase)